MKDLDILAIGDIVIDDFIRLSDATIVKQGEGRVPLLGVAYGEKIPYESRTPVNGVGNAANAAVSASRLGTRSGLLTYIGDDRYGQDCVTSLSENKVDTSLVRIQVGKKTNYHYVLWYDVDRTILVKHESFDYSLGNIGTPKWIYLSSLGEKSLDMYKEISTYLSENPEVHLAFQPGVFDMKLGTEVLKDIYARAETVCVNVEEAQLILHEESRDVKVLLQKLADLGPKKVFITDGFDGAYAHDTESKKFYFIPIYPHAPYERTGAGDAFFSTAVVALSLDKSIQEALTWGPINSMSVVQEIGAQKGLLSREKLEAFLEKAPKEYAVREI